MPYKDPEKKRQRQRERTSKRREAWLLANGPCSKCGSSEGLEVDHIDPATKVSHKVWSWSDNSRAEELAKCQVLCKSCHKAKTKRQTYNEVPCGTHTRYIKYKCRCAACKVAHALTNSKYRKRSGLMPKSAAIGGTNEQ